MKQLSLLLFLLIFALILGCSKDESKEPVEEPDTIAPEVMFEIAGLPGDNGTGGEGSPSDTTSVVVPNVIVIEISAEDAKGVEKVEAFVDGEKAGEDLVAPFSITVDFSKIQAKGIILSKSETQYTLKVTATDLSGNQSSVEKQVIVDGEMPVIAQVSMESDLFITGDTNPVSFVVNDNEGLESVTAKIGDTDINVVALDSSGYELNLNTLELPDGPHVLTISALDLAANEAQYQLAFTADNTNPSIGIKTISTGSDPEDLKTYNMQEQDTLIPVITNTTSLDLDAQDGVGVAYVELFVNDVLTQKDSVAPYEVAIDIANIQAKSGIAKKTDTLINFKVKVYDMVANTDSIVQQAYLDNIKPVISGVTIAADSIMRGTGKDIGFNVTENDALELVSLKIDEAQVELLKDTTYYAYTMDTNTLQDGEHTIAINAKDRAGNAASTSINFMVDNTAPELAFTKLTENQILDTTIMLEPLFEDATSGIDSVRLKFNDSIIVNEKYSGAFTYALDPETIPVGPGVISLWAVDHAGNQSEITVNTEVRRKLLTVTIGEGFLHSFWESFWIVASEMDGSQILSRSVSLGETEIVIYAPGEFPLDKDYQISFIAAEKNDRVRATNIQKINRANFTEMNFQPREVVGANSFQLDATNFGTNEYVKAQGNGYYGNHLAWDTPQKIDIVDHIDEHNYTDYYFYSDNLEGIPYAYTLLPSSTPANSILDRSDLTTNNVVLGDFKVVGEIGVFNAHLTLYGYLSQQDYDNKNYHTLFSNTTRDVFGGGLGYYYSSIFTNYRSEMRLDNYFSVKPGLPQAEYTIPSWGIAANKTGSSINLSVTGNEAPVGRLYFLPSSHDFYYMTVIFPSNEMTTVNLPELPVELSHLTFYQEKQAGNLNMVSGMVSKFDNISTYTDYLNMVIKDQKEHFNVSEVIECMSINSHGYYKHNNFDF